MSDALAAYQRRIGLTGDLPPTRATLNRILYAHATTIPFEGIDPLLGRPVDLTPDALVAKLVGGGRGGFCFEHNLLLKDMLETIGFAVTALAARVLWNGVPGRITPRTHMLLEIALPDGPVLADAGFGGNTLTAPLDLIGDVEQATPHEPFRLIDEDGTWRQEVMIAGEWRPTYRFTREPQHRVDADLSCWYMATSPRSHFVYGLTCALARPDRRLALRNFDYAIHHRGGPTEQRRLGDPDAVADVVERDFGIRLPDRAAFVTRLARGVA